jgi:hypothetical protein
MTLTLKPLAGSADEVVAMPVPPAVALHNAIARTKAREESRKRAKERARDARGRFKAEERPTSYVLPLTASAAGLGVMIGVALARWWGV